MTGKYLTEVDYRRIVGVFTVRALREEEIDGVPSLVLYLDEEEKGLILTKQLVDELVAALGPHPLVAKHFGPARTQ